MDDTVRQAAFGLSRIGAFLRSSQWRQGEELGLTPTQQSLVAALHRLGAARIQALASALGVTHATASDAISALQSKGLIEKRPDPFDGRAILVDLTGQGRLLAQRADFIPAGLLAAIGTLGADERSGLSRSLTGIIRSLQDAGLIDPQRLCVTCRFFRPNAHPEAAKPHHCAYVDAAFGDEALRLDCSDHIKADDAESASHWRRFSEAKSA
ncbi:MAG: MarR family transcriptional regulator [Rhodobiaceae bacterium]|nr:MarR family transcriptional regulator [Rhodobiaceae bacterium]